MDPRKPDPSPLLPPGSVSELRAWRAQLRTRFVQERLALDAPTHAAASLHVLGRLSLAFPQIWTQTIGLYWPVRGELALDWFVDWIREQGGRTALPVVISKDSPLEFHLWHPDTTLARDLCGIPGPPRGVPVQPEVMLVPVVGFDNACYRLGYGGGYYDRTLATLFPKPLTIGIGLELGHVETIFPQPFDVPLEFIFSEHTVYSRGKEQNTGPAAVVR